MTDILFGQSYYLRFDPKLYAAMQPYPPLGTLFAAAYLRQAGYQVTLFDAMLAESEAEWEAALDQHRPRYAVLFEDNFNYLSKMCLAAMRTTAFKMCALAKARGIPVIVCGADASDYPEAYLAAGADIVLRGEGEESLREVLAVMTAQPNALTQAESPLKAVAGLSYRHQESVQHTPARPVLKNLDDLPLPAWDLVDVERYQRLWRQHHGYYSVNMVTTRGCPYRCNWCAKPIWGQRYNVRSPQNVIAELRWLKTHLQPDHIWFADDIFGLKKGWVQEFAALVEAEGLRTPFKCLSRADLLLDEDTIQALGRAGAEIVWMGAESGSQKILDAMDKGTRVEEIYAACAKLKAHNIRAAFFLQFGYPSETRADIQKTIQMVRDCLPDDIGISVSYPLPGTKFYERVKHDLSEKTHWQDSADLAMLYQGPYPTAFYRQLHTVIHKDYRARRTWARLRAGKLSLYQRHAWRELAAMLYHRLSLPRAHARLNKLARQPHRPTQARPLPEDALSAPH